LDLNITRNHQLMKNEEPTIECFVCDQKLTENMKTLQYTVDQENYSSEYIYECEKCGAHWKMLREDSYHHPIVSWNKVIK
jgi:C4-type Zn-finger protein